MYTEIGWPGATRGFDLNSEVETLRFREDQRRAGFPACRFAGRFSPAAGRPESRPNPQTRMSALPDRLPTAEFRFKSRLFKVAARYDCHLRSTRQRYRCASTSIIKKNGSLRQEGTD